MSKVSYNDVMRALYLFVFPFLVLSTSCSLLNSGSANVKYSIAEATFNGVRFKNRERFSDISVTVRNVQHPKPYGKWAANIKITPSIHFDRFTFGQDEAAFDAQGNPLTLPDMKIDRLAGMGNLKLYTHTPLGAFVLSGGFGGSLFRQRDGMAIDTIRTGEITKVELVWVGFLSERFFILMGPRYFKEDYESLVFAFRIGYFWGDIVKSNTLFGF